jgi:hypothetical protein
VRYPGNASACASRSWGLEGSGCWVLCWTVESGCSLAARTRYSANPTAKEERRTEMKANINADDIHIPIGAPSLDCVSRRGFDPAMEARVECGSGRHVEARCQPDSNVQVCIILRSLQRLGGHASGGHGGEG